MSNLCFIFVFKRLKNERSNEKKNEISMKSSLNFFLPVCWIAAWKKIQPRSGFTGAKVKSNANRTQIEILKSTRIGLRKFGSCAVVYLRIMPPGTDQEIAAFHEKFCCFVYRLVASCDKLFSGKVHLNNGGRTH